MIKDKINKNMFLGVAKGVLIAICISLVAVLIFAAALSFIDLDDNGIRAVIQVVKVISVFSGCFIALKKEQKYGLVKGMVIGILYTIIAFLTFSLLDGAVSFTSTFLYDLLFSIIIGALCGIICANVKAKDKI